MYNNQNQQFKEYPNQNFIEMKFKDNQVNDLNQNQALLKYKLNSYIVGRIFSFNQQDYQQEELDLKNIECLNIEDLLKDLESEVSKQNSQNQQNQQTFIEQNKEFHQYMGRIQQVKSESELQSLIEELQKKEMILKDYPFFNKDSPFYQYKGDSLILEVDSRNITEPLFQESDYPSTLQL